MQTHQGVFIPRLLPAIAATSVAAVLLSLSACSNAAPTDPASSAQQSTPREPKTSGSTTSSPSVTASADPTTSPGSSGPGDGSFPASKILTGSVAGFTLEEVEETNSEPLTKLSHPYYFEEHQLDPAACEATGIEKLVVGSQAQTEHEIVTVALGSDVMSPERHQQYAKKCAEVNGTIDGYPALLNIEKQKVPDIEGAGDVVATMTDHGIPGSEGDAGYKSYVITGNVGNTNVVAYTTTTFDGNDAGVEASFDTVVAVFKAQVDKLRG